jgi:hypothetical protein
VCERSPCDSLHSCTLLPYVSARVAGALLFGPARTLLWSSYFHYLAQPRRYPRALAGRTLGYANLIIALTSDAPLYALNALVDYASAGSGARRAKLYRAVHAAIQALLLGCTAFPIYLHRTRAAWPPPPPKPKPKPTYQPPAVVLEKR